ncbi:MAG: DUF1080 domain-containing protein [Bryobacterales bacterium]|nr:DUF1080 domain-containing protein [Bryobacterales bacterium]
MYKTTGFFLLLGQCWAAPIEPARPVQLFNGRDLTGFYTWLRTNKYEDPKHVFSVSNGLLRISGEEWGGLTTKEEYRNYRLIVEWKWGGPNLGERATKSRDSGILVHGAGEDGAGNRGTWLESYESQIIEGGTGDIIIVTPNGGISLTADTRTGSDGQLYWQRGGTAVKRDRGRINWYARDLKWKDVLGFRGTVNVEKPVGEWNRTEVICQGDRLTNKLNGKVMTEAYGLSRSAGKIQIQSEGAEILIRKIEMRPLR